LDTLGRLSLGKVVVDLLVRFRSQRVQVGALPLQSWAHR
jgi:hypothetical protein